MEATISDKLKTMQEISSIENETRLDYIVDLIQGVLLDAIKTIKPKDLNLYTARWALFFNIFTDSAKQDIKNLIRTFIIEDYIEPIVFLCREIISTKDKENGK